MQIPSEMCKCLCIWEFINQTNANPICRRYTFIAQFYQYPFPQSCFPNCKFPNDFDKYLKSHLILRGIFEMCGTWKIRPRRSSGHALPTGHCYVPVKVQYLATFSYFSFRQENPMLMQPISQNLEEIVSFQLEKSNMQPYIQPKCSQAIFISDRGG